MNTGPDFLGIGAQKSGTTWLEAMLRRHPGVWMPPVKELHWFDEPVATANRHWLWRLCGQNWSDRRWRRHLLAAAKRGFLLRPPAPVTWKLRFLFGRRSDDWYADLFRRPPGRIAGEITPAYLELPEAIIARVAHRFPGLRLLVILRHPVERAWSQARMELLRRRRLPASALDPGEAMAFLSRPEVDAKSRYATHLSRWFRHFPADRFGLWRFEDLVGEPERVAAEICTHLRVAAPDTVGLRLPAGTHVGVVAGMPDGIRRTLAERYREEISRLGTDFGFPIGDWLDRCQPAS